MKSLDNLIIRYCESLRNGMVEKDEINESNDRSKYMKRSFIVFSHDIFLCSPINLKYLFRDLIVFSDGIPIRSAISSGILNPFPEERQNSTYNQILSEYSIYF